jgi:hypothetical protein
VESKFSIDDFKGEFNILEKNSSIVLSSNTKSFQVKIKFNYNYQKSFNLITNTTQGTGSIDLVSNIFNYTQIFDDYSYDITQFVNVSLIFVNSTLENVDDESIKNRISDVLKEEVNVIETLTPLGNSLNLLIVPAIIDLMKKKELAKIFVLQRKDGKNFMVSYALAADPVFPNNDSIIYFLDGSLKDTKTFEVEDANVPRFTNFTSSDSDFQLFMSKKIFFNLFRLNYEKKLFTIYSSDLSALNIPEFSQMSINWLNLYYPDISLYRPRTEKFYIEYYFNSITWENNNAKVDITFFFVTTDNIEICLEYRMTYYFLFEVLMNKNSAGFNGLNFVLRNPESFIFRQIQILTDIRSRFDYQSFNILAKKIIPAMFSNNNYYLLKDYEPFTALANEFDTLTTNNDGVILSLNKRSNIEKSKENVEHLIKILKFLN